MGEKTIKDICPICKLRNPRTGHWACEHCERKMTAEEFNQWLIDHQAELDFLKVDLS